MSSGINRLLFVAVATFVYAGLGFFVGEALWSFAIKSATPVPSWAESVTQALNHTPFIFKALLLLSEGAVYALLCSFLPLSSKKRGRFSQFFFALLPFVCASSSTFAFFNNFYIFVFSMFGSMAGFALFAFVLRRLESKLQMTPFPAISFAPNMRHIAIYGGIFYAVIFSVIRDNVLGVPNFVFALSTPLHNEIMDNIWRDVGDLYLWLSLLSDILVGAAWTYFYAHYYATRMTLTGSLARVSLFWGLSSLLFFVDLFFLFGAGLYNPNYDSLFFVFAYNSLLLLIFFVGLEYRNPLDEEGLSGWGR